MQPADSRIPTSSNRLYSTQTPRKSQSAFWCYNVITVKSSAPSRSFRKNCGRRCKIILRSNESRNYLCARAFPSISARPQVSSAYWSSRPRLAVLKGAESLCTHFWLARDANEVAKFYRVRPRIREKYRWYPLASRFNGCWQQSSLWFCERCPVHCVPRHASRSFRGSRRLARCATCWRYNSFVADRLRRRARLEPTSSWILSLNCSLKFGHNSCWQTSW